RHRRRPARPLPRGRRALRPRRLGRGPGRGQGRVSRVPAGDRAGPLPGRRIRRAAAHRHPGGGEGRDPARRCRRRHERADAPDAVRGLARHPRPVAARQWRWRQPGLRRGRPDLRIRRRARPPATAAARHRAGRRAAGRRRRCLRHDHGQHLQPARAAWRERARGEQGMSIEFDRGAVECFRFVDCGFDAATGVARLRYAFDDGPELVETVTVPGAPFALDGARAEAVEQALRLLHLVAGVSYYKAAVPEDIRIDGYGIDADTATLLEDVYLHGLGEFAYRNGLDLHGRIRFPCSARPHPPSGHLPPQAGEGGGGPDDGREPATSFPRTAAEGARRADGGNPAASLHLREHALVAIGGGKDSLVSIEALRAAGIEQTVCWIGGSQLIAACAARTGLPTLNIGRQLAPELFEYNRQGAYNGHIPVTAINSAILAFAAVLLDANQVVFSNERSASYGSIIEGTGEVNHQWSKGWAFEQAFAAHLRRSVAADLGYYSLLRPLSELAVARQFARIDRYDAH